MQTNSRIKIADILRGWALLGVIICNYTYFAYSKQWTLHGDAMTNTILQTIEGYLLSAKGWTLLHVLFGFGFGVFLERNSQNRAFPFVKRMLYLFVFAFVNTLFFEGDILRDYALLGLLILPFYKLSSKKLVIISIVMFLLVPFVAAFINTIPTPVTEVSGEQLTVLYHSYNVWDVVKYNLIVSHYDEVLSPGYMYTAHYVMFLCMLVGLMVQKNKVFEKLELNSKMLKRVLFISLFLAVALNVVFRFSMVNELFYLKYFELHYWIVLSTMVFTTSCICLLHIKGKCKKLFHSFATIGRMTLTNYMMQNVISFFVFKGVGLRLFDTMPFYFYFVFAITLYVLQILFSTWWLNRFKYGPVEWLWRTLSKTKSNNVSEKETLQLSPVENS